MALESESLLLLHVAPCSFRPGGGASPPIGSGNSSARPLAMGRGGRPTAQLWLLGGRPPRTPWAGAPSEDYQAPRAGELARLEAGAGSVSEQLRQWAGSPHTPLTRDAEAAGVEGSTLRGGDIDLQAELLQGPAVGLGHVLPGGGDVRLRHKQAAQTHVDVLWEAAAW